VNPGAAPHLGLRRRLKPQPASFKSRCGERRGLKQAQLVTGRHILEYILRFFF
jgi:hypothetical protein